MNIDTLDSVAKKIIVKKDAGFSGGTGFYITEYKDYVPQKTTLYKNILILIIHLTASFMQTC